MFLKKIVYAPMGVIMFFVVLFVYGVVADRSLGKGYVWTCFEPGCSIVNDDLTWNPSNKKLMTGIMGDICELSLARQYIIGRVCKANNYAKKHDSSDPIGYFILDKINLKKSLGMTDKEFLEKCKALEIEDCKLRYTSPLYPVYDWYYWYIIFMNNFD